MSDDEQFDSEFLALTEQLLGSIANADWDRYTELCADDLTCFEPESLGHQVEGMTFHHFYFELGGHMPASQSSIVAPRVRRLGSDAALVTYTRLVQTTDSEGRTSTHAFEETRVWQRVNDAWKHVHFHRSTSG